MSENKIIPTCGTVILDNQGNVVLVEHQKGANHLTGSFGLPAGKIEIGESALDAAVREVFEETGLSLEKTLFKKISKTYKAKIEVKDGFKSFSFDVFTVLLAQSTVLKNSSETKAAWVPISDISKLNLLPNVHIAIQDALSEYGV